MRVSSELFLTGLLNAAWQIALVAAAASLASWFLRQSSAKYRHFVWTFALLFSFFIPLIAISSGLVEQVRIWGGGQTTGVAVQSAAPLMETSLPANLEVPGDFTASQSFQVNRIFAFTLIIAYLILVGFRLFRLAQAWRLTRHVRRGAVEIIDDERITLVMRRCEEALGTPKRTVTILSSTSVHVPVTIGLFSPVIILPTDLLGEGNLELLTSAIGHEYIHVARRDYVLNLIYEFLYVPLSFHPAAALIRRRIRQTRELCCDELVAERILKPEVYARSLVKLAGCAPRLRRLSITTTVGIADADILEARIMSLLRKPKLNARWKQLSLVAVSFLLVVPCLAAAAFAMRFEMQPSVATLAQEPRSQEKEKEKEKEKLRREIESREFMEGRVAGEKQARATYLYDDDSEVRERREIEMKMRAVKQAALVRLARIQMDQAIQIATSQQPGKVLECTLNGENWEEPGKLAKEGTVFYSVVIISGDEPNQVLTHVRVNAIDGTVMRAEKELPRKMRRSEQP